ncbi:Hypothetical protein, putative [Bodo saltans]|uniref:Uncharacterized protein n=1 Tax=Bodo saltans TaxID=75058 RepID=A0A0S4JTS1_BODSA|nr:Hypothetical protein, putative [Bodo saltans]|eukprot:CUG91949.1 Hypothetical protein, putative [Bodo saltans]
MADEEFIDAADDWELEALRQEEEEATRLQEEERLRKEKEEKDKKRRLAAETAAAAATAAATTTVESVPLDTEAKQFLETAQREMQDQQAAANLLGSKVDSFADREIHTVEDAAKLGADIAQRFARFDGEFLGAAATPVFEHLLKAFSDALALRELETALNVAKQNAKTHAKSSDKKPAKLVQNQNALDLDTTDRGGAAEAQDDCGW